MGVGYPDSGFGSYKISHNQKNNVNIHRWFIICVKKFSTFTFYGIVILTCTFINSICCGTRILK